MKVSFSGFRVEHTFQSRLKQSIFIFAFIFLERRKLTPALFFMNELKIKPLKNALPYS
jgi:hypothetical protein